MGYGGILLDAAGEVLQTNTTATRILLERVRSGHEGGDLNWTSHALRSLLKSTGEAKFKTDRDAWAVIECIGSCRPVVVRAIPLATGDQSVPHKAIVLVDLNVIPRPTPEALITVFALTPFEARLAVEIASGKSPEEIAALGGTTVGTIRRQLATVFAKTNTHRQSELVALLVHLAILP